MDLLRDEESGAIWPWVLRAVVEHLLSVGGTLALVGLRSDPQFWEVSHDTHAHAMRALVAALSDYCPDQAIVGRTSTMEFAVVWGGESGTLRRALMSTSADAETTGRLNVGQVAYTTDWVIVPLEPDSSEPPRLSEIRRRDEERRERYVRTMQTASAELADKIARTRPSPPSEN